MPRRCPVLEEVRERREGERHPLDAVLGAPRDDLGGEPLVHPVRRVLDTDREVERQILLAGPEVAVRCDESPVGVAGDRDDGIRLVAVEQVAEDHRETALVQPAGACHDRAQLLLHGRRQLALAQELDGDAAVARALDRLAHVAILPSGQGESARGAAPRRVRSERCRARTPTTDAWVRSPAPIAAKRSLRRRAIWTNCSIAASQDSGAPTGSPLATATPSAHPIAERRLAIRREHVLLVAPQGERSKRIALAHRDKVAYAVARSAARRRRRAAPRNASEERPRHFPACRRNSRVVRSEQVEVLDQPFAYRIAVVVGRPRDQVEQSAQRAVDIVAGKGEIRGSELAGDVIGRGIGRHLAERVSRASSATCFSASAAPRFAGSASRIAWNRWRARS